MQPAFQLILILYIPHTLYAYSATDNLKCLQGGYWSSMPISLTDIAYFVYPAGLRYTLIEKESTNKNLN